MGKDSIERLFMGNGKYAEGITPEEVRKLIRKGEISGQTSGMCNGYAQANLVILPQIGRAHV